eukprot:1151838-Pelagomonas_calceolata.AAC.5
MDPEHWKCRCWCIHSSSTPSLSLEHKPHLCVPRFARYPTLHAQQHPTPALKCQPHPSTLYAILPSARLEKGSALKYQPHPVPPLNASL